MFAKLPCPAAAVLTHFMQKPSECARAANFDARRNAIVRNGSDTACACAITNYARSRANVTAREESGASVLSADSTHTLLRLWKDD